MKRLDEYIISLENIIPHSLCDQIIQEFSNSEHWISIKNGKEKNLRSCFGLPITQMSKTNLNFSRSAKIIDEKLFDCAAKSLQIYKEKYPSIQSKIDSGYDLLKYEVDQYYGQHTDYFEESPRELTCSFFLNDDYGGGEFAFFDKEIVVNPKKGSAIMFPSSFMFPHQIMPITSGIRYSIVTWFM